jgi:hypothetical protein
MFSGAATRFERVTDLIGLVVPTTTLPKASEVAETELDAVPVPVRAAVTGLFVALEVTVSDDAGTAPKAVGVNLRAILQVAPAASEPGLAHVVEGSNA